MQGSMIFTMADEKVSGTGIKNRRSFIVNVVFISAVPYVPMEAALAARQETTA